MKMSVKILAFLILISHLLKAQDPLDMSDFPTDLVKELLSPVPGEAEKIFLSESDFQANPIDDPNGLFSFDYYIEMDAFWGDKKHRLRYYINSKDGSYGFTEHSIPTVRMPDMSSENRFDFMVIFPGVAVIRYGVVDGEKLAMKTETKGSTTLADQYQKNYLKAMGFLNSIKFTEQEYKKIEDPKWDHVYSIDGEIETFEGSSKATLYFASYPTLVKTSQPMLGMSVGVFKDYQSRMNKLLVRTELDDCGSTSGCYFHLIKFQSRIKNFSGKEYEVVFNTRESRATYADIQKRIKEINAEIEALYKKQDLCVTDMCFEKIDRQLTALEEEEDALLKNFERKYWR